MKALSYWFGAFLIVCIILLVVPSLGGCSTIRGTKAADKGIMLNAKKCEELEFQLNIDTDESRKQTKKGTISSGTVIGK